MKLLKVFGLFAAIICISGCSLILGTSMSALEKETVRHSKTFDKDAQYCYEKTLDALKKWNANAFLEKKYDHIIATRLNQVFNSCIDTTEVGIFFKAAEGGKTQVDVASLNLYLSKFVAENLFKYIEDPNAPTCPIVKAKPFKF